MKKNHGPSFFELLTSQADQLVIGVDLLITLFKADDEQRPILRDRLHEVEHGSDEINHQLVRKLHQSFVTPFDREDISQLASNLDDCMDYLDEAGDLLVLYKLTVIPEPIASFVDAQIDVLARCAALTAENMPKLKRPQMMGEYWIEINRLENDGDKAYRRALQNLFDAGLDPITIIKLKDIIETLEKCADAFENLANEVEAIAVKES